MKRSLGIMILLSAMTFFWVACAGMPQAELDEAQAAMDAAQSERAPVLATGDWENALEAWNEARSHLAQKSYRQARTTLITARSRFEKAKDIAESKRAQILEEAQNMKRTIEIRYERLKERIETNRPSASVRRSLESAFEGIDEGMVQLTSMIQDGKYMEAKDHSVAVMRQVYEAEQLVR